MPTEEELAEEAKIREELGLEPETPPESTAKRPVKFLGREFDMNDPDSVAAMNAYAANQEREFNVKHTQTQQELLKIAEKLAARPAEPARSTPASTFKRMDKDALEDPAGTAERINELQQEIERMRAEGSAPEVAELKKEMTTLKAVLQQTTADRARETFVEKKVAEMSAKFPHRPVEEIREMVIGFLGEDPWGTLENVLTQPEGTKVKPTEQPMRAGGLPTGRKEAAKKELATLINTAKGRDELAADPVRHTRLKLEALGFDPATGLSLER